MSVITTGNHPKALWPGVFGWFGEVYNDYPEQWRELFDYFTSEKNYEEVVQNYGFGLAPIKTQGASISYDVDGQGYTTRFTHQVLGLGYIVTREEIEDNQYEQVSMDRAAALKRSMHQAKENYCANVYNRAFNSSYTGGDGVSMINSAHPTAFAGNLSNQLAVAADISPAAIEDLIINIMACQDDRALRMQLFPKSLHVHRNDVFNATRILESVLVSGSSTNDLNVLKSMKIFPEGIKVNQYFNQTAAWFIRTDAPKGMMFFQRRPLEFTKDNDFGTENALAKATERYVAGWGDWRGIWGTVGV